jgi:glycosyltransferase involved in cell wall biosynthesis
VKVSVLIPTLNRLTYLKESLASACAQTHSDLEILVSDDGSVDGTQDYVRTVAATEPRLTLLPPNPHPGLYENYNYLIERVGGEAFGILDDDDRWAPDLVERLVLPLEMRAGAIASFCDHWVIAADGSRQQVQSDENSLLYERAALPSGPLSDPMFLTLTGGLSVVFALFRTSALKCERFDLSVAGAADVDYAIRVAQKGGELYYVNARLGEYRVYPTRTTSTETRWMLDGAVKVLEKYRFDDPAHERRRRNRLLAAYRTRALFLCTRDRAEWWRTVRAYARMGGPLRHWVVVLSAGLCILPGSTGEWARGVLKTVRAQHRRSSAAA